MEVSSNSRLAAMVGYCGSKKEEVGAWICYNGQDTSQQFCILFTDLRVDWTPFRPQLIYLHLISPLKMNEYEKQSPSHAKNHQINNISYCVMEINRKTPLKTSQWIFDFVFIPIPKLSFRFTNYTHTIPIRNNLSTTSAD